jgi:N-acetylglucosamine-6-phosphate deacetylase
MADLEAVRTLVRAARVVDAAGSVDDGWVLFDGTTIAAVGSGADAPAADEVVVHEHGVLVPGFVDLHGHGGAQGSFDGDADGIRRALAVHRAHGTTRSVLSLVAAPVESLVGSLDTIRSVMASDPLVLGAHLEGPFLSPNNRGAHEASFLVEPAAAVVDELLHAGAGIIRQITIAPELPGAIAAVRAVVAAGVVAAVGHTVGTFDDARAAFDAGATMLTHAFNAMPGIHHRAPGPIMAAVADERVTLELILDEVHVAPVVASMLFRAAPHRVALITDAMSATGSADGEYRLGSLAVDVRGGVAHVAGTETIAGSTLTQDVALRNAVHDSGLDLTDAVAALTSIPAAAIGEGARIGRLAPGYVADAVALSPSFDVEQVWANGTRVS